MLEESIEPLKVKTNLAQTCFGGTRTLFSGWGAFTYVKFLGW